MTVTVVVPAPERHGCMLGWEEIFHLHDPTSTGPLGMPDLPTGWYLHAVRHENGSVVECACGRTWVALPHLYSGRYADPSIVQGGWNAYRPERRGERRRRLRNQR